MTPTFRIAILAQFPTGDTPQGGVQSVVANLTAALAARPELDIHVIQHRRGVKFGDFPHPGYTLHNLPCADARLLPNQFRTAGLTRQALAAIQPDAVSSHQPAYTPAALQLGLPTVHSIHGFPREEFWSRRGLFARAATLWEVWMEARLLRQLRHIIAISDTVVQRYRNRTRARFHRVNNPVAPLFFTPAPPPTPYRLVLVGNLTARKGVEVAIAAVARLLPRFSDLQLEIWGPAADPAYAAELSDQARVLGSAVRFCGAASQAGIQQALHRAQALLLTSYAEHTPMIVAEAMACGRPVVATQVGALADMVVPGSTGYLAPAGDIAAVALALDRLLADPAHAAALGAAAAIRARNHYHPDAVAAGYLAALEEAGGQ